ncbi:TIGR01212 family radical SAM protein [Aestuariirhabdus sp. Z084]|uniref:TIGR01212 family radical SAM protein n=1 Tax=Aestuariirhabdus haliotis TaxID=2918751 RepID=UPI00201B3924|nr:TIGR01212 family radical SAM protein [Aestuariirhabdus haliotis]MCL6415385.1 TIGR01212 family radical SAM protein [Aestuariirhabdus haliotis]MCL6419141.1 TIGR01212 family radical SAM protein [Aestuariirhabdus haliotis]
MQLPDYVNTFGAAMQQKYGHRVHKLTINADFTCPNRDGTKGIGGCTFCNNASFSPNNSRSPSVTEQIDAGKRVILKRTGARHYLAYFQAYTNTYASVEHLRQLYCEAVGHPDVMGLSVGTRPDCVPDSVLDLLCEYRDQGLEVWLELGLQSANDQSLASVNRGHGWKEYEEATRRARSRGLNVCTHLIVGMPGEQPRDSLQSLNRVLAVGTDGLKLHPLHVVKGTQLARQWSRGEYQPLEFNQYVDTAVAMVQQTPDEVIYHRLTGTASSELLLAPDWCQQKWAVLNAIHDRLGAVEPRKRSMAVAPQSFSPFVSTARPYVGLAAMPGSS